MTGVQRILPITGAALLGGWVAFATLRQPTDTENPAAPVIRATSAAGQGTALERPAPRATAAPEPKVTPSASAPVAPSAGAATASPASGKPATLTTPDQQLKAAIDCDQKKLPEACEEVALALETGSAGTRDLTRAGKLRRVALTLYVKQCETDRAFACTRLAEMHEAGEFVQKNPRNAAALRARVTELCRARPNQIGCQPH